MYAAFTDAASRGAGGSAWHLCRAGSCGKSPIYLSFPGASAPSSLLAHSTLFIDDKQTCSTRGPQELLGLQHHRLSLPRPGATPPTPDFGLLSEFKEMVAHLQRGRARGESLDVVYNHTGPEGNRIRADPQLQRASTNALVLIAWRPSRANYINDNRHRQHREPQQLACCCRMVMDSLRLLGRLDMGHRRLPALRPRHTILGREPHGLRGGKGRFLDALPAGPNAVRKVKLIAETLGSGTGVATQVGRFSPGWAEWNGWLSLTRCGAIGEANAGKAGRRWRFAGHGASCGHVRQARPQSRGPRSNFRHGRMTASPLADPRHLQTAKHNEANGEKQIRDAAVSENLLEQLWHRRGRPTIRPSPRRELRQMRNMLGDA